MGSAGAGTVVEPRARLFSKSLSAFVLHNLYRVSIWKAKHVHVCMEVSQSRLQVAYRTASAIAFENGVNVLQEAHMAPSNGEFPSR